MGHVLGKMICETTYHAVLGGRPAQFPLDQQTVPSRTAVNRMLAMNNREVDRGTGCTFTMNHDLGRKLNIIKDDGLDIVNNALSTLKVGVG